MVCISGDRLLMNYLAYVDISLFLSHGISLQRRKEDPRLPPQEDVLILSLILRQAFTPVMKTSIARSSERLAASPSMRMKERHLRVRPTLRMIYPPLLLPLPLHLHSEGASQVIVGGTVLVVSLPVLTIRTVCLFLQNC